MVTFSPRRIVAVLAGIALVLTLFSLGTQVIAYELGLSRTDTLPRLFDLNQEQNIPTWCSSIGLLLCVGLLWLIARGKQGRVALRWYGLAAIFGLLSLDELASLHELLNELRPILGAYGIFYFAWVIPAIGMLCVFAVAYLRFWLELPLRSRLLFAAAGALYVGGALGMELIGAERFEQHGRDLIYMLFTHIEEICEMYGIVCFAYTLLDYLAAEGRVVQLAFVSPSHTNVVGHPKASHLSPSGD